VQVVLGFWLRDYVAGLLLRGCFRNSMASVLGPRGIGITGCYVSISTSFRLASKKPLEESCVDTNFNNRADVILPMILGILPRSMKGEDWRENIPQRVLYWCKQRGVKTFEEIVVRESLLYEQLF
jgi:hypothetical protein